MKTHLYKADYDRLTNLNDLKMLLRTQFWPKPILVLSGSDVSTVNRPTIVEVKEPPQKIVPQGLIDNFVSMAQCDSNFGDNDMSFHCAYSLPAVVLTLGKENWPLLKNTMDILAGKHIKLFV